MKVFIARGYSDFVFNEDHVLVTGPDGRAVKIPDRFLGFLESKKSEV